MSRSRTVICQEWKCKTSKTKGKTKRLEHNKSVQTEAGFICNRVGAVRFICLHCGGFYD